MRLERSTLTRAERRAEARRRAADAGPMAALAIVCGAAMMFEIALLIAGVTAWLVT